MTSLDTVAKTNKRTYVLLLVLATIYVIAQCTARDPLKLTSLGPISLILQLYAHTQLNICTVY